MWIIPPGIIGSGMSLKPFKNRVAKILFLRRQASSYAWAWQVQNRKALIDPLPLWVVLGDSLSQGVGASAYDHGWVGQASRLFGAEGKPYRIINLSVSGARVEDVLQSQIPALQALRQAPDLVTVLVGSNDLRHPSTRKNLLVNIEQLMQRLPPGTMVGDIFERPNIPWILRPFLEHKQASSLLKDLAAKYNLIVVPIGEAFRLPWRGKLAADFYHPNDYGYKLIADVFVKRILTKKRVAKK